MTPEQIERYKALCRQFAADVIFDYCNPDLEQLMDLPNYKDLVQQLTREQRRSLRAYRTVRANDGGLTQHQIKAIEEVATKLRSLHLAELNSRWTVKDKQTGLYWCRLIEPPYWGRKDKAFLFTQKDAIAWANKFCKASRPLRYEAVKIDATRRLAFVAF